MTATFLIDSLMLLPGFAFLIVALSFGLPYKLRKETIIIFCVLVTLGFWLIAGGFYFNILQISNLPVAGHWFKQFGDANNFMWNFERNFARWSYDETIYFWRWNHAAPFYDIAAPSYQDFWGLKNLTGMFLIFIGYPLMLLFWIQVRYLVFGRSPKQKGLRGNF